jgi:hypothetical protein
MSQTDNLHLFKVLWLSIQGLLQTRILGSSLPPLQPG